MLSLLKKVYFILMIKLLSSNTLVANTYNIFGVAYQQGSEIGKGDINIVYQLTPTSKSNNNNDIWYIKKAQPKLANQHCIDKFGSFFVYAIGLGPTTLFSFDPNQALHFFQKKAPGETIEELAFVLNKDFRLAYLRFMKGILSSGLDFDDLKFDNLSYDPQSKKVFAFDTGLMSDMLKLHLEAKTEPTFPTEKELLERYQNIIFDIKHLYSKNKIGSLFDSELDEIGMPNESEFRTYSQSDGLKLIFASAFLTFNRIIREIVPKTVSQESTQKLVQSAAVYENYLRNLLVSANANINEQAREMSAAIKDAQAQLLLFNKLDFGRN
ncbi:MAG: hypothetical protein KC505_10900 [Myxococcales bacterium]|nr:hypothetical protein [Myxococcales bacterium]USN50803.1 MAG: hypothetical protein H6731_11210 [Myxococcales bacterium]